MKKIIKAEVLEKFKTELELLKKVKRREIAERLKEAISFGDLKENAEYHEAKEAQAFLEGRIVELEHLIRNTLVGPKENSGKIGEGSLVTVCSNEGEEQFEIVNIVEADPLKGKITSDSPIGKAILGKTEKDICEVKTPSGQIIKYKILKIS